VCAERADDAHAIALGDTHDVAHIPRRIDDEALARRAVAEQVDEVLHALRRGVTERKVSPALELAHIQL
jgi:hypothetical protein